MTIVETTNRELYFAASLMARPEFVASLYPPQITGGENSDLRKIENPTARAAITILSTQGPTYANPNAMMAALSDLPIELDGEDVAALISLIPSKEEVVLGELAELKHNIEKAANERKLRRELLGAGQDLTRKPADEVVARAEQAIREYRQGSIGMDHSTKGILERMRRGFVTTRWKIAGDVEGGYLLDGQAEGIGPDGKFDNGLAGQGEIIVITAKYGTGKTRWLFNILKSLIGQGASCDVLAGEDNEASYSVKLMGCKFGLPKWKIERYIVDQPVYLNQYGKEEAIRIEEAIDWYASIDKQLRIYDGRNSKVNIFKFHSAKAMLEESVALHGTTHVAIDYAQIWKGDTPTLELYAQEMREFAARNNVGLIILSQIPNDAMKFGVTPGILPSKGTGEWGQIAHTGFFLSSDPIIGQKEVSITQAKGRDSGMNQFYAHFDVDTGRILEYYGTPKFMDLPQMPDEKPRKGGRR